MGIGDRPVVVEFPFAEVSDPALAVVYLLDRVGNPSDPSNPTSAMSETPVLNSNTTAATLNPSADLVVIRRVALIDKITTFVIQG